VKPNTLARTALVLTIAVFTLTAATRGQSGGPAPSRAGQAAPATGRSAAPLAPIPGTPWRIHDESRPEAPVVAPGATPGAAPADATLLFDGTSLSGWVKVAGGATSSTPMRSETGDLVPADWPIKDGILEVGRGSIMTRESFGDVQLHLEFAEPAPARGTGQDRGNSGIKFMGLYEIQILDSYRASTYADGAVGAIYGEYPPLVNVARAPGEWQTYDIVFEAPVFRDGVLVSPAFATAFLNGVLVQLRRPIMGATSATTTPHAYTPGPAEMPLLLQDHSAPVRFRNIWIRRLSGLDRPSGK
jgi:hypothetical protein